MTTAKRWLELLPATFMARWPRFPPELAMKPSSAWTNTSPATKLNYRREIFSSILLPSTRGGWRPCRLGVRTNCNPNNLRLRPDFYTLPDPKPSSPAPPCDCFDYRGSSLPARRIPGYDRDNLMTILEKAVWKINGANGAAELLGISPST